ncbi:MAG TPA: GrpB family protein [Candidatus Saccharimonadales bacterium]|nr:GrpB family protein [Candidatus Saccharimonadales bacterium]
MNEAIFHLQPWNPEVRKQAESLIDKIHTIVPELEILFMGAAALGLPGKNDIDLDILCDASAVQAYAEKLIPLLGNPKEMKSYLTSREFSLDGFEVDCILSDPKTSHVPLQQKRFEILKANPSLRNEYRRLKEESNGLPLAEYEKRKKAFLETRVLSHEASESRGLRKM